MLPALLALALLAPPLADAPTSPTAPSAFAIVEPSPRNASPSRAVHGPASEVPVVLVRGGGWMGSGVVWDAAARRVLTALHVVEEMPADAIVVVAHDARLAARVVDREPALDLALLEVAGPLDAGPTLGAAATLAAGDAIALAGCPGARCRRGDGRVIAPERSFAGAHYLAVLGEARPGASGGAVLDAHGAVVGIIDLALLREPGVALAVPIELATRRFPRS
jgi:serine protease Do